GHYVSPTVVAGLPIGHPLTREELFLPFVTVTQVDGLGEAIVEANAPAYGLTAGIFTEDETEAARFLDEIEAGVVYVNRRAGATTGAGPGHGEARPRRGPTLVGRAEEYEAGGRALPRGRGNRRLQAGRQAPDLPSSSTRSFPRQREIREAIVPAGMSSASPIAR